MRLASLFLAGVLVALPSAVALEAKPFRLVGIPGREHGYDNLKTRVIGSQKELDALIQAVEKQAGWNDRAAFLKGLAAARLNFDSEALVLIRQTEGSGSNKVSLAPEIKGDRLLATIQRQVAPIGTDDIANYCFAVAVERGQVKQVEVWVERQGGPKPEKPRDVLAIAGK